MIDLIKRGYSVAAFKMGRPQSEKTGVIHILLDEKESSVIINNKIVPPSSAIWNTLLSLLDKKFRPSNAKAIYSAALKWFETKSKSTEKAENSVQNLNIVSVCESSVSSDSNISNSITDVGDSSILKFNIELSYKVWETVKPVKKIYGTKRGGKTRIYYVLQPGVWSNVIVDAVTKKRGQISCSWTFKTNKCYMSGNGGVYLSIRANCNTCGAELCGEMENEPIENNPVLINFEIRGFESVTRTSIPRVYELAERMPSLYMEPTSQLPQSDVIR